MKKKFIGYYSPSKGEIDEAWEKGIFALDANTLLNFYRYTESTRNDFIRALQTIKEKLFLPYQAAYEYHENRLGVIEGIEKSYDDINSILVENFDKNLQKQLNHYKKHPTILIDEIINIHDNFLQNISKELAKQKANHPDFKTEDAVLNDITELFDNCVGDEFSKDVLTNIYAEGKERYAKEIPPGYKDESSKQKKGLRNIYGDLIIWKELLNYTKNKKLPLIFITDDRKEDWWTIEKGKTIRPREELIKEFFDFTGIRILIYNADHFLTYAKERNLLPELKEETIEEVKDIRVSDEKYYTTISDFLGSQAKTSKTIAEFIGSGDFYKPAYWANLIGTEIKESPTALDFLKEQTYNPLYISEILKTQREASKSVAELLGGHTYYPQNLSEILKEHKRNTESISDFLGTKKLETKIHKKESITPKSKPMKDDENK